jgi:hypothetical protein
MQEALGGFDATTTYSAAAEDYARASRNYWQLLSTRTVDRLPLRPGQHVLDAACGTAPATIAAAGALVRPDALSAWTTRPACWPSCDRTSRPAARPTSSSCRATCSPCLTAGV